MMTSLFRRASAALLPLLLCTATAPAPGAAPALPDAEPAMWVVKDADTTIYLFGTFHALDGKRDWFNDEVRAAFDASLDVVLEVLTPENPAELGGRLGVSRQAVNAIETGKHDPSLPLAFKLARLFAQPIEEIFTDRGRHD